VKVLRNPIALSLVSILLLSGVDAYAQAYPTKPIRIIDPWAPGGGSEQVSRPLAAKLSDALGQNVFIEAKPGASSIIGTDFVARSVPDGYTLLMGSKTITTNATLYKKLPYDSMRALTPISIVSKTPFFVVVNGALPTNSVKDLIQLAKSQPGKINLASSGTGTAPHLAGEMFALEAGIKFLHIPYKGNGPALLDLLKGDVQLLFTGLSAVAPHVKAGKLKLLAYAGQKRSPQMPDIPTVAESGLPNFEGNTWYGLFGPAGLPREIRDRLAMEVAKIMQTKDMQDRFVAMSAEPVWNTPDEFAALFKEEMVKQAAVVKASGASLEF